MRVFRSKSRANKAGRQAPTGHDVPVPTSAHQPHIAHILRGTAFQAKLDVSAPEDPCEQEADQVAESVMRMSDKAIENGSMVPELPHHEPEIQRACAGCEDEEINRKENDTAQDNMDSNADHTAGGSLGMGSPLPESARTFFEPRFGRDFSEVRVHADVASGVAARNLNAQAFTVGNHIAFAPGKFSPETDSGKSLMAHELTHVVQQGQGNFIRRKKEVGTYISTLGPKNYLQGAAGYFKHWGYPNIKNVSSMEEVVQDLSGQKETIDSFRIVSHGLHSSIDLGLTKKFSPGSMDHEATTFQTPQAFSTRLAGSRLIDDETFDDFITALKSDTKVGPLMTSAGIGKNNPAMSSSLGLLLRAVLETEFISQQPTSGTNSIKIKNVGILNSFNSSRLSAFKKAVIQDAPKADQASLEKNLNALIAGIPTALVRVKKSFAALTQSEADTVADPFLDPAAKSAALNPEIEEEISQGSGQGSFLNNLTKVKGLITPATHIEIRGCSVGGNASLLDDFRGFFGNPGSMPSISAPDLYQYFFGLKSFEGYGDNATETQRLDDDFKDSSKGISQAFETHQRISKGEMLPVVVRSTLAEFCTRYNLVKSDILALNPELKENIDLLPQQKVWLAARVLPAGNHKDLSDFCAANLGNAYLWPKIWGYNPQIVKGNLSPSDQVWLAPDTHRTLVASLAPTAADYSAFLKSGKALMFNDPNTNHPTVHVDAVKRADAMGDWLAAQQYDFKARDAKKLGKTFGGSGKDFAKALEKTFIGFLSHRYSTIEDPIFPDDPRYKGHIIHRP